MCMCSWQRRRKIVNTLVLTTCVHLSWNNYHFCVLWSGSANLQFRISPGGWHIEYAVFKSNSLKVKVQTFQQSCSDPYQASLLFLTPPIFGSVPFDACKHFFQLTNWHAWLSISNVTHRWRMWAAGPRWEWGAMQTGLCTSSCSSGEACWR